MKRKKMVVEDDRKMAELIRLYLEKDGYRGAVSHDGGEGLEMGRRGVLFHPSDNWIGLFGQVASREGNVWMHCTFRVM